MSATKPIRRAQPKWRVALTLIGLALLLKRDHPVKNAVFLGSLHFSVKIVTIWTHP